MGKTLTPQTPKLAALLQGLGENIRLARLRRRISATMLAERAGMTRVTLAAIECGEATVSLGAYANVLFSLGLEKDLCEIARDDVFGRKLQDAALLNPRKTRLKEKTK
jgi:transcriptional regulator with XRE-family HTH domain